MTKRDLEVLVIGLWSPRPIEDVHGLLKKVEALSKENGIELQLVDASKVYGKEHLELSALKAIRAFEEGRNFGKTLAVEVLLYASGKRQISEAIKFMGLRQGMKELGLVAISSAGRDIPKDLAQRLGFEHDDKVLEGSDKVLEAYGIGPGARKEIPKERRGELVLERVALLDLEK